MEEKKYQITISAKAAETLHQQLEKRGTPQAFIRLGVRGGGCSGFSYVLQFEDSAPNKKDIVLEVEGINVVIDGKSIIYLNGCTLDWEKTLMNQGFKFVNPHEKAKCGCGHSFTV
jgi:iron-sulfur cluster assembly protein